MVLDVLPSLSSVLRALPLAGVLSAVSVVVTLTGSRRKTSAETQRAAAETRTQKTLDAKATAEIETERIRLVRELLATVNQTGEQLVDVTRRVGGLEDQLRAIRLERDTAIEERDATRLQLRDAQAGSDLLEQERNQLLAEQERLRTERTGLLAKLEEVLQRVAQLEHQLGELQAQNLTQTQIRSTTVTKTDTVTVSPTQAAEAAVTPSPDAPTQTEPPHNA